MAINYPTSLDSFTNKTDNVDNVMAVDINDVQDAIEALEAKVGIDGSADDTSIDYKVNNFFVENVRKLWFYENSAPTGWTYESSITDKVLAVKGGSQAYNRTGGSTGGTWTVGGLSLGSESGHTHTVTIPASGWSTVWRDAGGYIDAMAEEDGADNTMDTRVLTTSGGSSHSHSISQNATWRPSAAVGIIAKYTGA